MADHARTRVRRQALELVCLPLLFMPPRMPSMCPRSPSASRLYLANAFARALALCR
jgi:hypothetical protein